MVAGHHASMTTHRVKQRWVRLDDILPPKGARLPGEHFTEWFTRIYGVHPDLVVRMHYAEEADMVEYRDAPA